jgi:hypothetical protein
MRIRGFLIVVISSFYLFYNQNCFSSLQVQEWEHLAVGKPALFAKGTAASLRLKTCRLATGGAQSNHTGRGAKCSRLCYGACTLYEISSICQCSSGTSFCLLRPGLCLLVC